MPWRMHGRARVNPNSPAGFASCDRCGFLYNLVDLKWETQWFGNTLQKTWFRVCDICLDKPADFLKTIVVPADPVPLYQPRPEPYAADEAGGGTNYLRWDSPGGFWNQTEGEPWDNEETYG